MSRCSFCEYKGKKILQIDFDNCQVEEFERVLAESAGIFRKQPKLSVLTIGIIGEGTPVVADKDRMAEYLVSIIPHIKASALVGLPGVKGDIIRDVIKQVYSGMEFFGTEKEARDWLASIE